MRFGLYLPPFAEFADPRLVAELAKTAEAAGWEGLFLWDHMLAKPGMAVADAWVTMAAVAAATTRLRFGAMVTPLPRRRPWVLARQMATLDQLSEGRLIGGIGLGDDGWAEFSSFGDEVHPVVRGQILDEALELLQQFLSGEAVRHAGSHFAVNSSPLLPKPRQNPLPIWGAVRWPNRKPMARIAKLQGCFPIFQSDGASPPDPAAMVAIRETLDDLGGAPDMDMVVRFALSQEPAARVTDTIAALQDAGVTWILEGFPPGVAPDYVDAIVRKGPPR